MHSQAEATAAKGVAAGTAGSASEGGRLTPTAAGAAARGMQAPGMHMQGQVRDWSVHDHFALMLANK